MIRLLSLCRLLAVVAALLILSSHATAQAPAAARPNIVLILCDDLGQGDLGCYNAASKTPTPHMDALAKQGMRFTDMHTPSSVCTPTRYGLLTGRYCWRSKLKSGVLGGYSPALIEADRLTLPAMLQKAGYRTGGFGKWHLGLGSNPKVDFAAPFKPSPLDFGFDEYFGIPASLDMDPYVWIANDRAEKEPTGTIGNSKHRREGGGGFWRGGGIAPGFKHIDVLPRITEKAIDYIDRCAKANEGDAAAKPFFAYVPLTSPHTPWMPTDEWMKTSKVGYYGAFVSMTDDAIGRIVAALERNKISHNTLVIVTSDNGSHWPVDDVHQWDHKANGDWRGQKSDVHEGGHRVPFIVRWPGKVKAGSVSGQTGCLTDMIATLAQVAGRKLPAGAGEDSFDLSPALLGTDGGKPIRPAVVHHSGSGLFAIRSGEWKLIMGLGTGGFTKPANVKAKEGDPAGQLYNLATDPGETKNVYKENPDVVKRLGDLLEQYKSQGFSNR